MSLMKRCLTGLGVILMAAGLTGCPKPALHVEPLSKSFGETATTDSFRIYNTGAGTLTWQISESIPWLRLSVDGGATLTDTLAGNTATEVDVIGMYLDRSQLPYDTVSGEIQITSNGGTEIVRVSATKRPAAQLLASDTEIDFGLSDQQRAITLSNGGVTSLTWKLSVSSDAPWLTAAPLEGTLANVGNNVSVTLNANRSGLAAGTYTGIVTITSNGGNAAVTVTMAVPPFTVSPYELPFGTVLEPVSQQISLKNSRFDPLPVTMTVNTGAGSNWLSVPANNVEIPVGNPLVVLATANPAGLTPGSYSGEIRIAAVDASYEVTIAASMVVPGLSLSSAAIDFGTISEPATRTVTLGNLGAQPIIWQAAVPLSESRWLSVNPSSGTLQTQTELTLTAVPGNVDPGSYRAELAITSDGGDHTVVVTMVRPRPSALKVEPASIDFGATRNEQLVAIWNDGIGTVDWRIDAAAFPAWLSLSPVDAQSVASGSVSGDATATVTLKVDRTKAPDGATDFAYSFLVEASGGTTQGVTVETSMSVPLFPILKVDAEGEDADDTPFINFDVRENSQSFVIRNEGTGPLDWSLTLKDMPKWITSVSPSQGTLPARTQQTVTVTVDRSTLDYRGDQYELPLVTNDPAQKIEGVLVEIQVAKVVVVRASPVQLAFGENQTSTILSVANFGDPDTTLNFKVTSTKEWLSVFPNTGSSLGTTLPNKDWRDISVSVDRSQLEGLGASAKLSVFATKLENGVPVQDTEIAAVEVTVTVDATPLTIEAARPAQRVPSMARYVLLMRDIQYRPILYPEAQLGDLTTKIRVYEDDIPMDASETNQFITPGRRARGTALILLDYSGSMQQAAGMVTDEEVSSAPNPLQALYEKTIPYLINEMPENYRVAMAVFSERGSSGVRLISDASDEPLFTTNKNVLQNRLMNANVLDNGATMLYEAFSEGLSALVAEDGDYIPFDTSDDRILIVVTDGRVTTPPGEITPYVLLLQGARVRPFVIGWGLNTSADPLIRLSANPGGHYYATHTADTGLTDTSGDPIRLPIVSELQGWCETTDDPCDRSIAKDLASQIVFSYISLNEMAGVTVEGRMSFDNPNDLDSPCIEDQGEISGSYKHTQIDFLYYSGDPRLGQIRLETEGIGDDDTADVIVRADYMPRNINQLTFNIQTVGGAAGMIMDVQQITQTDGGVIHDWARSGGGNTFTFTAPETPLLYGEFGDLLRLRFTHAANPFDLRFEVLYPQITAHPDSKYFTHPDNIRVENARALAPSAPYPQITAIPALNVAGALSLGATEDMATVSLTNIGGSHEPTSVGLYWEASLTEGTDFLRLTNIPTDAEDRMLYSSQNPYNLIMTADRSVAPGVHYGTIEFTFDSVFHNTITRYLYVSMQVLAPNLVVSANTLIFDSGATEQTLTVSNSGQSTLLWGIDFTLLPEWLTLSGYSGTLGYKESTMLGVYISRPDVNPSDPSAVFNLFSTTTGQTLPVTVSVAP